MKVVRAGVFSLLESPIYPVILSREFPPGMKEQKLMASLADGCERVVKKGENYELV